MFILENNRLALSGIVSGMHFSHTHGSEEFKKARICVPRDSGTRDEIVIMYSNAAGEIADGDQVQVAGSIRTRNVYTGERNKLEVYLFADRIAESDHFENHGIIEGYICKPPVFRQSPSGKRVCDLMIAVNRSFGKSDYIPCIAWGRNAAYVSDLSVGTKLRLTGRMQSRHYTKQLSETESEDRVAYEFSVSGLELRGASV